LKDLQEWGKRERQWPDVPYHFYVAPDGRIFEGRPVSFAPESDSRDEPKGSIGVQLWGDFEEQRVGLEQLAATVHLVAWLCDKNVIPPSTIQGHRDVAVGTVCPGRDLHRYITQGDLRVWVAEMLARRQPDIKLKDALVEGPIEWIPVPASGPAVP
jgi:N-acetyl-anhydromuramyl-L-alanine amidase AmpD